jgi:thymidylate synthase
MRIWNNKTMYEINYKSLIKSVIDHGIETTDRTGTGTIEQIGATFTVRAENGFPLLTSRKMHINGVLGELAAFLQGATKTEQFRQFGCNYWNAWGEELGPVYGAQWLDNDQLYKVIEKAKQAPDSRQLLVSAWNWRQLPDMALPPCHFAFQLFIRKGLLDIVVYQRSLDVMLGLPSDVVLYKVLQLLIARELQADPGCLVFQVGSAHIYKNHIEAAFEYLSRPIHGLPEAQLDARASLTNFTPELFKLVNYNCEPPLINPLPLSV